MKWINDQIECAVRWLDMMKDEAVFWLDMTKGETGFWIMWLIITFLILASAPSHAMPRDPESLSPHDGPFFTHCRAPHVDTEYRVIIHWQEGGAIMEACSIVKAEDLDAAIGRVLKEKRM